MDTDALNYSTLKNTIKNVGSCYTCTFLKMFMYNKLNIKKIFKNLQKNLNFRRQIL